MEMNIEFFVIAALATVFAGTSKGGFGSGAAFASSAILATVIDPGVAVGFMLPLLMVMDLGGFKPYWKKWNTMAAFWLILGALPGGISGALFFSYTNDAALRVLIGVISIAFVVWQVAKNLGYVRPVALVRVRLWGIICGVAAGFTSFVSHAGGPPAAIYLLARNLGKTEFQATTVLVFWAVNLSKVVPYAALGLFSKQSLLLNVYFIPFALFGVWLGVVLHRWMSEKVYFGLTYVLLLITGARLIWMAFV